MGPVSTRLKSEFPGAAKHLRCANLVRSQPMHELSGIGGNALEMQQRHKSLETWIGRSRADGFDAHG